MTPIAPEDSKKRPELGETVELEVLRLSSGGGRGVAKHNGMVIFTPLTVAGDRVKAKITKVKKAFCEAELVEVIEASKERIKPLCPVFQNCGGCTLQMMTYNEQLLQKESFLSFAVNRVFKGQKFVLDKIQASPKQMRYRNRIQVHQEGQRIGFFKKKSHQIVSFKDCLITDLKITEHFKVLTEKKAKRRVELALSQKGELLVSDKKLSAEESLFSQVNTELNFILIAFVLNEIEKLKNLDLVFDLYAGSGNFSFPLAENFNTAQVEAVELSKSSVEKAKSHNNFENLNFTAQDVAKFLKYAKKSPDLVLLDPPRKGLSKEVVESLLNLKPRHIFYISCDLASASRDLELLKSTYELIKAKPFDMFPQTDHLESFFHLKLK